MPEDEYAMVGRVEFHLSDGFTKVSFWAGGLQFADIPTNQIPRELRPMGTWLNLKLHKGRLCVEGRGRPVGIHERWLKSEVVPIRQHENEIKGNWLFVGGVVQPDPACLRIQKLIRNCLVRLAASDNGWEVLYVDPEDGRFWELTYPQGEMHGGGPPKLQTLSLSEATVKYRL
jgi:hypothetical protein